MTRGTLEQPATLSEGELITENGIFDLTMEAYHGQPCEGESLSSSGARTIWNESPAHFYDTSSLNPQRRDPGERPHFSLGRATHHLVYMGRKGFDDEFAVRPDKWKDWRTDAAKEWRKEQLAARKTIVTDGELEQISGMARSLAAHPLVQAGILSGFAERSLIFKDPATGVWLKSRPDNIPTACGDFADLKTTTSVSTDALCRTIAEYGYHIQGALVGEASRHVLGVEMQSFTLVFVETKPPHCVRVVTLRPEDLNLGARQLRAAVNTFADCVKSGNWPGPGDQNDGEALPLPKWASEQAEKRLKLTEADPAQIGRAA